MNDPSPYPDLDYCDLLRRYVRHVLKCEGETFIDCSEDRFSPVGPWTPEERIALKAMENEALL